MRYAAVGLTLVACGRFGFDPIDARRDDAALDVGVGIDATDGRTRMVPTFVQSNDFGTHDTMIGVTYGNDVAAGDLLVVAFGPQMVQLTSISDSTGDTFTMLPVFQTADISPMYVGYAIAAMSAPETITVQVTGSDDLVLRAHEYASVDETTPVDTYVTNGGSSSGTNSIAVGIVTESANELVFAYAISQSEDATAGIGFNARSTISMDVTEDQAEAQAGMHLVTASNTGSPWGIVALALIGK